MGYHQSAAVNAILVLLFCMTFATAAHSLQQQAANEERGEERGEEAAERDARAEQVREALRQHEQQMWDRIEQMWEDGAFETDSGGIIPFHVFRREHRTLTGLYLPDVLRRAQFDESCERIGLTAELDEEERDYLEHAWAQYADEVNRAMLESYPPAFEVAAQLGAAERPMTRAVAAHADELARLSEEAMRRISAVERRLLTRIATMRDGEFAGEIDRWRYERQWERSMALHPWYPGATMHLTRLLHNMNEEWPSELAHLQRLYEMDISQAAARFYSHHLRTMGRLVRLQAEQFYDATDQRYEPGSPVAREASREAKQKAKGSQRERMHHERRLYAINTQYLTILTQLDDTGAARLLEQAFHEQAFPDIYPNEFDLMPVFQRFLSEDGLAPEAVRESVRDLADQYEALSRSIHENAKRFILRNRERDSVERSYHPDVLVEREKKIESYINDQRETSVTFAIRLIELVEPVLESDDLDNLKRDIVNVVGEVHLHY